MANNNDISISMDRGVLYAIAGPKAMRERERERER
jgi:hypothetical protein